ncbi:hypothetical protein G6W61_10440 [Streptomyces sp. KAI-26]|uniref:hypothetical protein n=1 Tax=Streptomyces sp. KAI-26 TaxID=1169747 RepID=UPI001587EE5B|nr:hypothetical protein [Streptomyces sp. KAI-26]NUV86624.1 hypothetical protein [Streptomyces sp. KAI-26]NUW21181.1 hypothetical protein [Streptomyces roseoviolaceus]
MKTVDFRPCECGIKRGFLDRRAAGKALGRAQAKRDRQAQRWEGAHPMQRENRVYQCDYGMWHLTKQSRRVYEERVALHAA